MIIRELVEDLGIESIVDSEEEECDEVIALGIRYTKEDFTLHVPLELEVDELYEKIMNDLDMARGIYINLVNSRVINSNIEITDLPKWVFVYFILYHEEAHHLINIGKLKSILNYNFYQDQNELNKVINDELHKIKDLFITSLGGVLESRSSQLFSQQAVNDFSENIINKLCRDGAPNYQEVENELKDDFITSFESYYFQDVISNITWYDEEVAPLLENLCDILIRFKTLNGLLYRYTEDEMSADIYACKRVKKKAEEVMYYMRLIEKDDFEGIFNIEL